LDEAPGFDGLDGPLDESPAPVDAGVVASPLSDDDPDPADDPFSDVDDAPSERLSEAPSSLPWDELDFTAVRRSRFAQPDPL
jgi:hypothetical protein